MSAFAVRPEVLRLKPYVPGRPVSEVQQEYGLSQVTKLASNENPLGPSPQAMAALAGGASSVHTYPEVSSRLLREALARFHGLPADWIMVGNGSDEILWLLAAAYVRTGDRCLVPGCSFPNYRAVAELFGGVVEEVALQSETMDLEDMGERAKGARMLFLCRPNNPTGAVFAEEHFRSFMHEVPPDCLVLVDQAYHEFDESPFDAMALLEQFPNLVLTRTFSKAYGLAGLRVGYGMGRPEIWQPLYAVREPFSVNALAQAAALAALSDTQHLQATVANNRVGRLYLEVLCRVLNLNFIPSQANFLMIDVRRPASEVYQGLLRQGIIVRPCTGFGRASWLRVSVGTPEQNERFGEALRTLII